MKRYGLIIVIIFFLAFIGILFSFYQQRKVEILGGLKTVMVKELDEKEAKRKQDKDYVDEIVIYSEYDLAYILELHKNYSLAGLSEEELAAHEKESAERKALFERIKGTVKQEVVDGRFMEDISLKFYHRDVMIACAREGVFDIHHPKTRYLPFIYIMSSFRDQGYIMVDQERVILPEKEGSAETIQSPGSEMVTERP